MRYLLFALLLMSSAPLFAQQKLIHRSPGSGSRYSDDRRRPGSRFETEGADGRHIVTFSPFSGMVSYGSFNPGVGVDYEYIVDKKRGIGVHVPLMIGYAGPEQSPDYDNYRHTMFYTAPGVRFHTGDGTGKIDFATGPSILIGSVNYKPNENIYNPIAYREPYSYTMTGIAVDNQLNFQNRHFIFGLNVTVGSMFEEHENTKFFLRFGLHFGGKF